MTKSFAYTYFKNTQELTPLLFKEILPEFKNTDDTLIQTWINDSDLFFDKSHWGKLYLRAAAYWIAAHIVLAQTQKPQLWNTDNTQETVGEMSVGTAKEIILQKIKYPWMRTIYGQQYQALLRMLYNKIVVV